MKFDKNLAALHGYLCGDGYVLKIKENFKNKHYTIGLSNQDKLLLKDFQSKFNNFFSISPHLYNERCQIANKEIHKYLTKEYSYHSYEWIIPKLSNENLRYWLRAFFDCEGWVEAEKGKNRSIKLECVNYKGINQIKDSLLRLGINSIIKTRNRTDKVIYRLNIFGLENIKKFEQKIGFLSIDKSIKLKLAINSYINYNWNIPLQKNKLLLFIKEKGRISKKRKEIRFHTIKLSNLKKLKYYLEKNNIKSNIIGPHFNQFNSKNYYLTIKSKNFDISKIYNIL